MSEKVLITGITGFVGSHLADLLLTKNYEVYGIKRWRSNLKNIAHIIDKLHLIDAELRDLNSMIKIFDEVKPDLIFHLAAQSYVPMSWKAPSDTIKTNVIGTVHLFEAIRLSKIDPKIQVAGSSEEYGLVYPTEVPIKETNPLRPLSPYAISKVAEDMLGFQYHRSYGLKIVITRAFNHTGPRRDDVFVASTFARQIAEIETGRKAPIISVGNLNAQRDFTDVRDIVRAYWLSLMKCRFGEIYNICSEKSIRIKEVLDILLKLSVNKDIKVKVDPTRMRPSDVEIMLGDCSKFKKETGWVPEISFEKTMNDLLDYWRQIIKN